MHIGQLVPQDAAQLEAFLASHRDSSMFLRANARRAGLLYQGKPFQATYVGAFRGGEIVGVAAHGSNGMLLIQAPEFAAELARACVACSERRVTGLTGPREQVGQATASLQLNVEDATFHADEWLYALDLSGLIVPAALSTGTVACRAPRAGERDALCAWRLAYDMELLGATDTVETRRRSANFLDQQIADGNVWLALDRGAPVSLSAFNATLPDIVQLGGIYTPPELRGRGFAKVAVAASLLAARERGAERAVLFTNNPSAIRTYEALGFRRIGDYALIFLP
jgi:uncharacterized protein